MKYSPIFFLLLLSITACTEVIELDLNDADPQLVVDATLTNTPLQNQVILTRSGSYFEPGEYERVSGATVEVQDQAGDSWLLEEGEAGVYSHDGLIGQVGSTYTLSITADGQSSEGSSELLSPVTLDSLSFISFSAGGFALEGGIIMRAHFPDPADEDLYLRFIVSVNDTLNPGIFLYDGGNLSDDEGISPFTTIQLEEGDQVQVLTLRIDRPVYTYFSQLAEVTGQGVAGPGAAAPTNPTSNLSGDVLGYFGASSVTVAQAVVD